MTSVARVVAIAAVLGCAFAGSVAQGATAQLTILSMTVTDTQHVWVLGLSCPPSPNQSCSNLVVRGSQDGGLSWPIQEHVPAAPNFFGKGVSHAYVRNLQYATPQDAYASGPSLLTSHDGGETWTWQRSIYSVEALAPVGNEVWAVSDLCPRSGACPVYLYRSPASGDAWHRTTLPLRAPAGASQIVTADNGHVWILTTQVTTRVPWGRPTLIESTTSGRRWVRRPDPCPVGESNIDRLATDDGVHLWLVCGGQPAAGGELMSLYRSPDGGRHWRLVASNEYILAKHKKLPAARFVYGGYVDSLAVTGPQTAWFSLDRGTLFTTRDGGKIWHPATRQNVDPEDATVGPVLFATPSDGWLASYPNLIFRTVNGGKAWQRIPVG